MPAVEEVATGVAESRVEWAVMEVAVEVAVMRVGWVAWAEARAVRV